MKAKIWLMWLVPATLGLAACGGDHPPGLTPVVSNEKPPNFISYPDPNLFVQGVTINPLVPTITGGTPTNYLVQPDLPVGLRIDAEGRIVGTPTQNTAPATYIVTAGNTAGTTSFGVRITVVGRYVVGGTVTGLTGTGLVLTVNGVSPLNITADGSYTFPDRFVPGDNFDVGVATQPSGQSCSVTAGSGVIANSDYHGAFVACSMVSKAVIVPSRFEDLVRALDETAAAAQPVACFFASTRGDGMVMTLGFDTFELRALAGAELPLPGCGAHLVDVNRGETRVYVMDVATGQVSVFATH
jgi:hypothetical protein